MRRALIVLTVFACACSAPKQKDARRGPLGVAPAPAAACLVPLGDPDMQLEVQGEERAPGMGAV